jgi:hypothetical protein
MKLITLRFVFRCLTTSLTECSVHRHRHQVLQNLLATKVPPPEIASPGMVPGKIVIRMIAADLTTH